MAIEFRLRLLGTPHLEGPQGITPHGPRRLALLAMLAAAGPGGMTRDKIVALLWPDANDERARRSLSQLLYVMKSEVGADLVEGTNTLRLTAIVGADVVAFDAAVAAKRDADAVSLYTGAFLDGFHVPDSSEFSFWADAERDSRAAQVRAASVRDAQALSGVAAVAAWRRAWGLDPLSAPVALGLMNALAAMGDRAAAVRVADQHATVMRAELESEPDPTVVARATELRQAPPIPAAVPDSIRSEPDVPRPMVNEAPLPMAGEVPNAEPQSRWHRYRRELVAAGLVAIGAIALLAFVNRAPARLGRNEFVLMSEFVNSTSDSLLTHTVGAAMAAALQQSANVVPLPRSRVTAALRRMELSDTIERLPVELARDVAQREGVRLVLAGEVIGMGASRQLISRIIEAATGRVVVTRTVTAASDDDLLAAVDQLAARMRRDLGDAAAEVDSARPLPAVTTPSLAALHAFAAGVDAERREERSVAIDYYQRAVQLDSTFAAAHTKVGEFYALNNDVPRSTASYRRALALLDRLPLDEQLRIKLSAAWARGDYAATVDLARTYVAVRPRDVGAWARLAYSLFYAGQEEEARAAYAKADSLAPLPPGSLMNVGTSWLSTARQSRQRADFDSALAYYRRAIAMTPKLEYDSFYNQQYGTILLGASLPDSAHATFERMAQRGSDDRARGLRSLAFLSAWEGRWGDAAKGFAAAAELSHADRQWTSAVRNDALVADVALTTGDPAAARAPLARAQAVALREPLETRAIAFVALAQIKRGDSNAARQLLARMRAMARQDSREDEAALLAVEGAIALNDRRYDLANERLAGAFMRDSTNVRIGMLRARALEAVGQDVEALRAWDKLTAPLAFGLEGQFDLQLAGADRARLLDRLGRREEAEALRRDLAARYPDAVISPRQAAPALPLK